MNPSFNSVLASSPRERDARRGLAAWYTPGLSDGIGDRLLMFDNSTSSSLELLRFKHEFSDQPAFEAALRQRVDQLSGFSHPSIAKIRAVEWLGEGEGLALISNQAAGTRLSDVMKAARGPAYAIELIRQLTPVLAELQASQPGIAHGTLNPDRVVVTPEGRLVIIEHVLAPAVEALDLSPGRARDLGLVVQSRPDGRVTLDCRSDVIQLGCIALSLLLGRRFQASDYPEKIAAAVAEAGRAASNRSAAVQRLQIWLERALQLTEPAFSSAHEAQESFGELPDENPWDAPPRPQIVGRDPTAELLPLPVAAPPVEVSAAPAAMVPANPESAAPPASLASVAASLTPTTPAITPSPIAIGPPAESVRPAARQRWLVPALIGLVVVEAALVGGLLYARLRRPPAAPVAAAAHAPSVVVDSAQPGTEVIVDGKRLGVTPMTLDVAALKQSIRLQPPDAAGARAGGAAAQGRLDVTSTPAGARVSVDGAARGVTPLSLTLDAGQHAVTVSDGSGTSNQTVTVNAAGTANVFAALAAPGVPAGWLEVTVPLELEVVEKGTVIGTTRIPRLMMLAGHHDLELVNTALEFRAPLSVDVPVGKTASASVAIPNGSVSINALPWANVFLDGRSLGTTPVANVYVPLGSHELILRHPQLGERRQTVVVTAKTPVRIVTDLRSK